MEGMISQGQQAAPQPEQGAPTPGQGQVADSQEAYDVATGQMLTYVYDGEGVTALTELMQSGGPSQGMARLFGRLLTMTAQSAAISGKRLAPALVFQGGIEVIRAMSEVAQANGLLSPEDEAEITTEAFYDGIALFATEAKEEALTAQEREQYVQILQKAEELERQGQTPTEGQTEQPQPEPEAQA